MSDLNRGEAGWLDVCTKPGFFVDDRRAHTAREIRDMCETVRAFAQRVPRRFIRIFFPRLLAAQDLRRDAELRITREMQRECNRE